MPPKKRALDPNYISEAGSSIRGRRKKKTEESDIPLPPRDGNVTSEHTGQQLTNEEMVKKEVKVSEEIEQVAYKTFPSPISVPMGESTSPDEVDQNAYAAERDKEMQASAEVVKKEEYKNAIEDFKKSFHESMESFSGVILEKVQGMIQEELKTLPKTFKEAIEDPQHFTQVRETIISELQGDKNYLASIRANDQNAQVQRAERDIPEMPRYEENKLYTPSYDGHMQPKPKTSYMGMAESAEQSKSAYTDNAVVWFG